MTQTASIGERLTTRKSTNEPDGQARAHAYEKVAMPVASVASVDYRSDGQVLVIGPAAAACEAARRLNGEGLQSVVMITDSSGQPGTLEDIDGVSCVHGAPAGLSGYLGNFEVTADDRNLDKAIGLSLQPDRQAFDLVLDLQTVPSINSQVPPPGYYAPGNDEAALEDALTALPGLQGDFEKPRYFSYDASICAHGRSGVAGCRRCIETCPTDAISSNGDVIQVNPNLCQGAGSCATACPAGAIRYAYPSAGDTLSYWRGLLKEYLAAGGVKPVLLVYDAQTGPAALGAVLDELPACLLPVEVEEAGSTGMDAWLAAVAWGAHAVMLLAGETVPASVLDEVDFQMSLANGLLDGMGQGDQRVQRCAPDSLVQAVEAALAVPEQTLKPATFAALDEKRTLLDLALDHLAQAGDAGQFIGLPEGAPFGEIQVDAQRCTLCMACVSQCPAKALAAGDGEPQLRFVEANCVQCGLCSRSCPEQAIQLSPRFLVDATARRQMRTLNADAPFHCVRCHKPFATHSVIARITEKMQAHPMFQGDALERLKMCEDCRVKDLYMAQQDSQADPLPGEHE